jgi:hypothetical protein
MTRAHEFQNCHGAARSIYLVTSVKARRRINKGAGVVMAGAGIVIMVK